MLYQYHYDFDDGRWEWYAVAVPEQEQEEGGDEEPDRGVLSPARFLGVAALWVVMVVYGVLGLGLWLTITFLISEILSGGF